jgi:hypothetical protein
VGLDDQLWTRVIALVPGATEREVAGLPDDVRAYYLTRLFEWGTQHDGHRRPTRCGTLWHDSGTRRFGATSGTRRQAADLGFQTERATGIEPAPPAWKHKSACLPTSPELMKLQVIASVLVIQCRSM